jgi:hypothetical protein
LERFVRRRTDRGVDRHQQLGRHLLEHGVDEGVLGLEPVEHRLLAHPDVARDLVERHGVDAAPAEQVERSVQDALAGRRVRHSVTSAIDLVARLSTIW